MESISKLMGHNNTKTTEDYYCGMRQVKPSKRLAERGNKIGSDQPSFEDCGDAPQW